MVRRTSFQTAECPVARSLEVVGDWWSLLIVRDARLGLRRFSEFEKSLGIAKNILTARLRNLIAHEIMRTAPASDGSAYLEYVLTSKGEALFPLLGALRQWGEDFYPMAGKA
jgi:DNA-binding HxlR family transcriptional regulator